MTYFDRATLQFDGSCVPNPGEGGSGYVIFDHGNEDDLILQGQRYIGKKCTNNVAEYFGLIAALKRLQDSPHRIGHLTIQGDSELAINQLKGNYNVNSRRLKPLCMRAQKMLRNMRESGTIQSSSYEHIDRRRNVEADRLANGARFEERNWSNDHYVGTTW
jgi:ribonuclease HI